MVIGRFIADPCLHLNYVPTSWDAISHDNHRTLIAGTYLILTELNFIFLMYIVACFGQVRPSVTFMISEPCTCCHGTGRVEALETSFSKIEQEISRLLVSICTE